MPGTTATTTSSRPLIDQALHDYLAEHKAPTAKPLVALMAMSVRQRARSDR